MTFDRRGKDRQPDPAMIAQLKSQVIALTDSLDTEREIWLATNRELDRKVIKLNAQIDDAEQLVNHWFKYSKLAGQRGTQPAKKNAMLWRVKSYAIRDVYMVCAKQLTKIIVRK